MVFFFLQFLVIDWYITPLLLLAANWEHSYGLSEQSCGRLCSTDCRQVGDNGTLLKRQRQVYIQKGLLFTFSSFLIFDMFENCFLHYHCEIELHVTEVIFPPSLVTSDFNRNFMWNAEEAGHTVLLVCLINFGTLC